MYFLDIYITKMREVRRYVIDYVLFNVVNNNLVFSLNM